MDMERKVATIFLSILTAYGMEYQINSGWNLLGIQKELNVSKLTAKIIWKRDNNKWVFYSNDEKIVNLAKNYSKFNKVKAKEGFWLYSNKKTEFNIDVEKQEEGVLPLKKGWNLVSLPVTNKVEIKKFSNPDIQFVWKYNKKWIGYSSDTDYLKAISDKYEIIDSILPTDGFWVYAEKDTKLNFQKNKSLYNIYYYFVKNGKIYPLTNQKIYDNSGNKVGITDSNGKIEINKPKTLQLKGDNIEFMPVVMNNKTYDYVSFVKIKDINITKIPSYVFDIGNYRTGGKDVSVEAAVIPKVFLNLSKDAGIIVKKFYSNQDLTLAVIAKNDTNSSIIKDLNIKLENSLGESISVEEAQFTGEFKPFIKSKNVGDVIIMQNIDNKLKYIADTYYFNGKYYSKKYIKEIGDYLFVKAPVLYTHKINLNNVTKGIVVDSSLQSHIIQKNGEFKTLKQEENITIFADNCYPFEGVVGKELNISMKQKPDKNLK